MKMFKEPEQFAGLNRERADKTRISNAKLADGEQGVVVFYNEKFLIFTEQQATRLATKLIDRIEYARKVNSESKS
jgi:hypothetical protein